MRPYINFGLCLLIGMTLVMTARGTLIYHEKTKTTVDYLLNRIPPNKRLNYTGASWASKGIEGSNRNYMQLYARINVSNVFEQRRADVQTEMWVLKRISNENLIYDYYLVVSKITVESTSRKVLSLAGIGFTLSVSSVSEDNFVSIRDWSSEAGSPEEYRSDCETRLLGFISPYFMLPPCDFLLDTDPASHFGQERVTFKWRFKQLVNSQYRYEVYCAFLMIEEHDSVVTPLFELKTDTEVSFVGMLGVKHTSHISGLISP